MKKVNEREKFVIKSFLRDFGYLKYFEEKDFVD